MIDGRNTLIKCYIVFTVGYIFRVGNDLLQMNIEDRYFLKELLFDISLLFNDAIPITCLCYFHYQNFKEH